MTDGDLPGCDKLPGCCAHEHDEKCGNAVFNHKALPSRAIVASDVQAIIMADAKATRPGEILAGMLPVIECKFLPPGFQMVEYTDGSFVVRTKDGTQYKIPPAVKRDQAGRYLRMKI